MTSLANLELGSLPANGGRDLLGYQWNLHVQIRDRQLWRTIWLSGSPMPNFPTGRWRLPPSLGALRSARFARNQGQIGVEGTRLLNAHNLGETEKEDLQHFLDWSADLIQPAVYRLNYRVVPEKSGYRYLISAPVRPAQGQCPPVFRYGHWSKLLRPGGPPFPRLCRSDDAIKLQLDGVSLGQPLKTVENFDRRLDRLGFCLNDGLVYQIEGQQLLAQGVPVKCLQQLEHLGRLESGWLQTPEFWLSQEADGLFFLATQPPLTSPQLWDLVYHRPTLSGCTIGMSKDECQKLLGKPEMVHRNSNLGDGNSGSEIEVWLFSPWSFEQQKDFHDEVFGARLLLAFADGKLQRLRGENLEIGGRPFRWHPHGLENWNWKWDLRRILSRDLLELFPVQSRSTLSEPYFRFFSPELGLSLWLYRGARWQWALEHPVGALSQSEPWTL